MGQSLLLSNTPSPIAPTAPTERAADTHLGVVEPQVEEVGAQERLVADLLDSQFHGGEHAAPDAALGHLLGERHEAHDGERRAAGRRPGDTPRPAPGPGRQRQQQRKQQEQQQARGRRWRRRRRPGLPGARRGSHAAPRAAGAGSLGPHGLARPAAPRQALPAAPAQWRRPRLRLRLGLRLGSERPRRRQRRRP